MHVYDDFDFNLVLGYAKISYWKFRVDTGMEESVIGYIWED